MPETPAASASGADDPARSLLGQAYAHCQEVLREGDRDRYLATLLTPADLRPHLFALYAFSLDVARIREVTQQPMAGEIRLQWWRDAVMGEARGDVGGHPIGAALADTMSRFRLPPQAFLNLLDARTFDLYDDLMPGIPSLEGYCGETASALFRMVTLILSGARDLGGADACGHGGVAYALTGLLRSFPWHARRGQVYLPADVMERHGLSREEVVAGQDSDRLRAVLADMRTLARRHLAQFSAALPDVAPVLRPAFLPVALVPLYLDRMERKGYAPFEHEVEVPQWRRQWRLWQASRV